MQIVRADKLLNEKKSVLIVDDDPSILRVFERILSRNNYSVSKAATASEAFKMLKANHYDAALIDLRLPDVDGIELLSAMPASATRMVKIMITGFPSAEDETRAFYFGAEGFMSKPVKPEELLKVLAEKLAG